MSGAQTGVISANYGLVEHAAAETSGIVGGMNTTNGDLGKMWTALQDGFKGQGGDAAHTMLQNLQKLINDYENSLQNLNKKVQQAVEHIRETDHGVSATFQLGQI
ncbi:WXG100 family type VII secretion target [Nocardia sp. CA2R105]|uniref:WXG100 family type VII secretion target n=1 Tax=Nocardia coffeae TaxID=2873381 RepID=UPI001CA704BE|nr:WXG100 family type VII secretion target [Nocardia coffeae]MBY8862758.1 WXG100 family type VII secretion target [Nocardia coffeae]